MIFAASTVSHSLATISPSTQLYDVALPRRQSLARARRHRTHESIPRHRRSRCRQRRDRLRDQHRLRQTCLRPHFHRTGSPLQVNLVRSHACGVGTPLSEVETRAMMLLRANALAKGLSGIRPQVVESSAPCSMLKSIPSFPSQGSVGASGDLAPLAHLAHVVIGEGHARIGGSTKLSPAPTPMRQADITPVALEAKEGLSLLNGTQGMLALLSLALARRRHRSSTPPTSPPPFRSTRFAAAPARSIRASCKHAPTLAPPRPQAISRISTKAARSANRTATPTTRPSRARRLQPALHAASPRRRPRLPRASPRNGRSRTKQRHRQSARLRPR